MIRSSNALNFAYILYLKLKRDLGNNPNIESWVRRWFVMSLLTGRYSGSPESRFDKDIKAVDDQEFSEVLSSIEDATLSDTFWKVGLVQSLNTHSVNAPAIKVFWAAQVNLGDKGFLSKDISVRDMLIHHGDLHHVFPKSYLKKQGYTQSKYNQVANYVYVQQEVNIKIGDTAPEQYINDVITQCVSKQAKYGVITERDEFESNLEASCLPKNIGAYQLDSYEAFLQLRREKMAEKIRTYYFAL